MLLRGMEWDGFYHLHQLDIGLEIGRGRGAYKYMVRFIDYRSMSWVPYQGYLWEVVF